MKKRLEVAHQLHGWLFSKVDYLQSPLLLAVRMYWGWQFFQTGSGKLGNLAKVTEFFASLGIPYPGLNAHFVAYLETVGGALLFLGLASRLIAIPLVINMTVAYWAADKEALMSIFSDPGKFYVADPYTFWFAALLILVFGPGRISLDELMSYLLRKCGVSPAPAASVAA
jgi:putative oxidoreductase